MLHDHLKGGKYDQPSDTLIMESESTPNENVFTVWKTKIHTINCNMKQHKKIRVASSIHYF